MSDSIIVQPVVYEITVIEDANNVVVSSVGVQGAKGDTGATGATGATGTQGSSGVVSVTSPITNTGTSTSAVIGINQSGITIAESQVTNLVTDLAAKVPTSRTISTTAPLTGGGDLSANRTLAVSAGSTSAAGVLQLTDSVSSTSTTTAATPNAVKTAYDNALIKPFLTNSTGIYYKTPSSQFAATTVTHQRTYYTPIFINKTVTFDRIACRTSTFVGTSTVRLGIYNESNGLPSTVLLDAGTVSCTAATTVYEITISQSLNPGMYFLAFCQQGTAPTTPQYSGNPGANTLGNSLISGQLTPSTQDIVGFSQSSVTGAFATASSLSATALAAYVWIRSA